MRPQVNPEQPRSPFSRQSFLDWCDVSHGQIPVSRKNFKATLLLAFISLLIGPELFDERFFIRIRGSRDGRILESNCNAVIPTGILSHVISRRFNSYRDDATSLPNLFEQGKVIFQKQLQKLLLMSPLHLVVVLDCVRLIRPSMWRGSL